MTTCTTPVNAMATPKACKRLKRSCSQTMDNKVMSTGDAA
jgi:hypothetical protein